MPDEADTTPPVEPAIAQGDIGLPLASADGPFIYFDGAPNFGFNNGIGNVTLEAMRFVSSAPNEVMGDRVVVAHLRMGLNAAMSLRSALDGIFLIATPQPDGPAN